MDQAQFEELKALLIHSNQVLEGSNHWHRITYEKLEMISLFLLQVYSQVQGYLKR